MSNATKSTSRQQIITALVELGAGAKSTLMRKPEAILAEMLEQLKPITTDENSIIEVKVAPLWTRVYVDGRKVAKISNIEKGRPAISRDARGVKTYAALVAQADVDMEADAA